MPDCDDPEHKGHPPFAKVDVSLLRNPTITPLCKALYALLVSFGPDRIFPSHGTLARYLGVKRRAVMSGLHELRRHGWVDWQRTGRSNRYRLVRPPREPGDPSDVSPDTGPMCGLGDIRCASGDTRSRSKDPDPSIHSDRAATAASALPAPPLSSPGKTGRDDAQSTGRSNQRSKGRAQPAVEAFRRATGLYPPRSWFDEVVQAVGDDPADLDFWHDVCKAFVGQGWKPLNVQAMLEYYARREIPGWRGSSAQGRDRHRRAGRKQRRDEYGGYTMSQRDALWARHKDRYLDLVAQGLDPHRQGPAFAEALGLTDEESHILHAAYSAHQSEQQPPMDPSYLDEDD